MLAIEEQLLSLRRHAKQSTSHHASAAKEAVWLSRLVADLSGFDQPKSIKVFADNQGAIDSGKNQAITQRNKHIDHSVSLCARRRPR